MTDLLTSVIAAHGGLERWRTVRAIDVTFNFSGGLMAQLDDIGAAVAFLASDEARWITGDTLRVDGGSKL